MPDFGIAESIALASVVTAVGAAGTSAYAANQASRRQNRVAKAVQESTARAAEIQSRQLKAAAALEKQKQVAAAERVRGRIRVAAAAAGFEDVGSYEAFLRQSQYDTALNTTVIDQNLGNTLARVVSGRDAGLAEIGGRFTSPVLAAFNGGVDGARSGLAIASAIPSGSGDGTGGSNQPRPEYDENGNFAGGAP